MSYVVEGTGETVEIIRRETLDASRPMESTVFYTEDGRKFKVGVPTLTLAEIVEEQAAEETEENDESEYVTPDVEPERPTDEAPEGVDPDAPRDEDIPS